LVATPAAVRFFSVEPMLEAIDLAPKLGGLDGLIVGGESGVGDRPGANASGLGARSARSGSGRRRRVYF